MDLNEFIHTDRAIAEIVSSDSDSSVKLDLVRESAGVAEDLAARAASLDELADIALRCASSYVVLNDLAGGGEEMAISAATWAARAAAAVAGRPAAEVVCLP